MQIHRKISADRITDRYGRCLQAKLGYIVSQCGAGDHAGEAVELVRKTAPVNIGRSIRKSIAVTGVEDDNYELTVSYGEPEEKDERVSGDEKWIFEVKSANVRITEGKELVRKVKGSAGNMPPDPGTAIGWDGRIGWESEISGTVIKVPEIYETCIATYKAGRINSSFKRRISNAVGKVNSGNFHGWDAGEVLLLAVEQSEPFLNDDGDELVDVSYRFAIRPNGTRCSGGIKLADCGGWNVVWNISQQNPVENCPEVCGIYESRVYDKTNFGVLGL